MFVEEDDELRENNEVIGREAARDGEIEAMECLEMQRANEIATATRDDGRSRR